MAKHPRTVQALTLVVALVALLLPGGARGLSNPEILSGQVDIYACLATTPTGDCRANANFQALGAPLRISQANFTPTGPDTLSLSLSLTPDRVSMFGSHSGIAELRLFQSGSSLGGLSILDWGLQVPATPGAAVGWSASRPLDITYDFLFFQFDAAGNQVIPTPGGPPPDLFLGTSIQLTDLLCPSTFEGNCTLSLGVPGGIAPASLDTEIIADVAGDPHRFVFDLTLQVVPEPGTGTLVLAGLVALARRGRSA